MVATWKHRADVFRFFLCFVKKSPVTDYGLFFLWENQLISFSWLSRSILCTWKTFNISTFYTVVRNGCFCSHSFHDIPSKTKFGMTIDLQNVHSVVVFLQLWLKVYNHIILNEVQWKKIRKEISEENNINRELKRGSKDQFAVNVSQQLDKLKGKPAKSSQQKHKNTRLFSENKQSFFPLLIFPFALQR